MAHSDIFCNILQLHSVYSFWFFEMFSVHTVNQLSKCLVINYGSLCWFNWLSFWVQQQNNTLLLLKRLSKHTYFVFTLPAFDPVSCCKSETYLNYKAKQSTFKLVLYHSILFDWKMNAKEWSPYITHLSSGRIINVARIICCSDIASCNTIYRCNAIRCSTIVSMDSIVMPENVDVIMTFALSFFGTIKWNINWEFTKCLPNQIAISNERATANIAFVILASRMRANVNSKLSLTRECHGTAITA